MPKQPDPDKTHNPADHRRYAPQSIDDRRKSVLCQECGQRLREYDGATDAGLPRYSELKQK